jgi:undecaprenyl-diphosphatase
MRVSFVVGVAIAGWAGAASAQPRLEIDPIADAAVLAGSTILTVSLQLILDTGELRPQEPGDPDDLLVIDRWRAGSDDVDDEFGLSNVGLGAIVAYAGIDTLMAVLFDRGDPWYSYAIVYLETVVITTLITNLVKIAVRRPRPTAYHPMGMPAPDDTNTALSFFSGHASVSAGLSATATYMAFARDPGSLEAWLVFLGGMAVTTFVSVARVSEGKHFPTDVIAGAAAGATVGTLVPHLHAISDDDVPRVEAMGTAGLSLTVPL